MTSSSARFASLASSFVPLAFSLCAALWSPTALAAPESEDTAPPDPAAAADAEGPEADAPAEAPADAAEAPADAEAAADADAPADAASEPVPEEDVDSTDEAEGGDPVRINPLQGSEARPPDKTIQVPVDIGDKHSITYTSLLAPRINPLGLEERLWIGYQYRLYDKESKILNGSNIGIFARPILSPAAVLLGATLQIQPAAVFRFRATYSYIQWFGTFQFMQSYKSPYDDWSENRLDGQADFQDSNYATGGHQVELEALVQARVKDIAIRSATMGIYNHYGNLRGDDDLFYAIRYDTLVQNKGWLLTNDTDVLWLKGLKGKRKATLMLGARATTVMPFYSDDVYEEGDVIDNPNGAQFRLGPAIGYIFYNRPDRFPRFNRPTLLLMPQWNIKHRFRSGRDVSVGVPTTVIAFAFTGQLWGRN